MLKLTRFSVEYPVTVLMFVLGILLLGYISFSRLGIDLFPDLNNPVWVHPKSLTEKAGVGGSSPPLSTLKTAVE